MMRIVNFAAAAALAASVALPALAENQAASAVGEQVQLQLKHDSALLSDALHIDVEGQTVYVRGVVDSESEYAEVDSLVTTVPGAHIVNATVVANFGS